MDAIGSLISLPFRVVRAPITVFLFGIGLRQRQTRFALPVAGLDDGKAQSLHFALRRAAATPEEEATAADWLTALQAVQVASMRLLSELDFVDRNLRFWTRRLESSRHFWFALFRHGPKAFFSRLGTMLRLQGGGDQEYQDRPASDAELVEKRVLIFRLLRGELCEALAAVQRAAVALHLQQSNENEPEQRLFAVAEQGIVTSMRGVATAFANLDRAVHATLDMQQGPLGAAAADRPLLAQALRRIMGMAGMRRILSSHQNMVQHGEELLQPPTNSHPLQGSSSQHNSRSEALIEAQRAVGMPMTSFLDQEEALAPSNKTVHDCLTEARSIGMTLQRTSKLILLPPWVIMPSRIQRNWVSYTVAGLFTGYVTIFVVRHSRLVGSRDLENWLASALSTIKGSWTEHVIEPLQRVQGELFNTFRRRPAIVSMESWEADRDSLQRMLDEFKKDYIRRRGPEALASLAKVETSSTGGGRDNHTSGNADAPASVPSDPAANSIQAEVIGGMELMMRSYEHELKRPLKHLVSGDLMRSLLIQVQKLKVDTESGLMEIDQILRANELSISLVAAVPSFLFAGAAIVSLGRMVKPSPPDPRREAMRARMAMIEAERALESLSVMEERLDGDVPIAHKEEAEGLSAFRIAQAYEEAEALFEAHRGIFGAASAGEWAQLKADLLALAAPGAASSKLRAASRMRTVYSIYQQF
jgi:hypothetical protein